MWFVKNDHPELIIPKADIQVDSKKFRKQQNKKVKGWDEVDGKNESKDSPEAVAVDMVEVDFGKEMDSGDQDENAQSKKKVRKNPPQNCSGDASASKAPAGKKLKGKAKTESDDGESNWVPSFSEYFDFCAFSVQ